MEDGGNEMSLTLRKSVIPLLLVGVVFGQIHSNSARSLVPKSQNILFIKLEENLHYTKQYLTIDEITDTEQEKGKNLLEKTLIALIDSVKSISKRGKLSVNLNPGYMAWSGVDFHLLDKILFTENLSIVGGDVRITQTISSNRVDLKLGRNWAPILRFNYDWDNRWRLTGDILWASTKTHRTGVFEAPASTETTKYMNSVHLWEGNYRLPYERNFSFQDDNHPSGYSPINWAGSTDLGITSANLYASYSLLPESNPIVWISGGLMIISMQQNLERSIETEIFIKEPDFDLNGVPDDIDGDGRVEKFQNNVRLSTNNRAKMGFSLGPRMGITVRFKRKNWFFQGGISQILIPVKIDVTGNFRDIDNMKWIDPVTENVDLNLKIVGRSDYNNRIDMSIPIIIAMANVTRQLRENWSVGIGVFYSLWHNVPTAPTFSYRDMTWRNHHTDLSFTGINLTVIYTKAHKPPTTIPEPSLLPELSLPKEVFEESSLVGEIYIVIIDNYAFLQKTPSFGSEKLREVKIGEVFNYVKTIGNWYEVRFEGGVAYVYKNVGVLSNDPNPPLQDR